MARPQDRRLVQMIQPIITIRDRASVVPPLISVAFACALVAGEGRSEPLAGSSQLRLSTCPIAAISMPVGSDLAFIAAQASQNASFCIGSGVHRMHMIKPKTGQKFFGERGAILSGAKMLTQFERVGNVWVATGQHQRGLIHGFCLGPSQGCDRPEAVFIDDVALTQVDSLEQLSAGQFFFHREDARIYLADDPEGKRVEATVTPSAFATNGARDVSIRGLVVEKYSSPAQRGAIYASEDLGATGWLIEANEVRWNSGVGILIGQGGVVRQNYVHHNGQLGVDANVGEVLIEDNEISHNNTRGFDSSWEAGGLKATLINGIVVRGNYVHHNRGPGLWCDIECRNAIFEDNYVTYNADAGIFYEISFDAVIRNNRLEFNGGGGGPFPSTLWFWGAQIQIAGSQQVEVVGNRVLVGAGGVGIALIDQGRKTLKGDSHYRTALNRVENNELIFTGSSALSGAVTDVAGVVPEDQGNYFDGNTYRVPHSDFSLSLGWGRSVYDFAEFQRSGQERKGRVIVGTTDLQP
jgi:hypothetical protein